MTDEAQRAAPGNPDDLSSVLKRLMSRSSGTRKTAEARQRLANDVRTRAFLISGLDLIGMELATLETSTDESPNQEQTSTRRPFFEWLSRNLVIKRSLELEPAAMVTVGMFRDRWPYQEDYIEDLLSFSLWERHWSLHASTAADALDVLQKNSDLAAAIQEIAYRDLCTLFESPIYKLLLIAAATAQNDPTVQEAIATAYRVVGKTWREIYKVTLEARGLKLRPDVSLEDLCDMLMALAEGLGLRIIHGPNKRLIDHDNRTSLLGTATFAIVASCIDQGDGRRLRNIVSMLDSQPPTDAGTVV